MGSAHESPGCFPQRIRTAVRRGSRSMLKDHGGKCGIATDGKRRRCPIICSGLGLSTIRDRHPHLARDSNLSIAWHFALSRRNGRCRRSRGADTASPTPEPRFKIYGWIDSGITFNPGSPDDNQNFGRLFDDRSNEPLLNQAVITFERALAPEPGKFDWGFKFQFTYGSDARFIHSLGLFSGTAATLDCPTGPARSVSEPSLSHHQRGRPRPEAW